MIFCKRGHSCQLETPAKNIHRAARIAPLLIQKSVIFSVMESLFQGANAMKSLCFGIGLIGCGQVEFGVVQ
jgi:hypothetical protein